MLIFPNDYHYALDFSQIIENLKEKTPFPRIRLLIDNLKPTADEKELLSILNQLNELKIIIENQTGFSSHLYVDLSRELTLLQKEGSVLTEEQILNIKRASVYVNE